MKIGNTFKRLATTAASFAFFAAPFSGSVVFTPQSYGSVTWPTATTTVPISGQGGFWIPNGYQGSWPPASTTVPFYGQFGNQQFGGAMPVSKSACKGGGYAQFGFRNQGQCVSTTARGGAGYYGGVYANAYLPQAAYGPFTNYNANAYQQQYQQPVWGQQPAWGNPYGGAYQAQTHYNQQPSAWLMGNAYVRQGQFGAVPQTSNVPNNWGYWGY